MPPSDPKHIAPSNPDDLFWNALNDASRRKMMDLLRAGPLTTGNLCKHFDFSRFAVMKHLNMLENAGLLIIERKGRDRINHLNPAPLQAVYRRWITPFETLPADRLLKLKELTEQAS